MRNYIGLANTLHDPAVAIVDSRGEVVFAEAAERYLQVKRAFNAPPDDFIRIGRLIREYCEPEAELVFASSWAMDLRRVWTINRAIEIGVWLRKTVRFRRPADLPRSFAPFDFPDDGLAGLYWLAKWQYTNCLMAGINAGYRIANERYLVSVPGRDEVPDPCARVTTPPRADRAARRMYQARYDHHLTHAAAACFSSPFEEAACAVVDGFGERSSCAMYRYRGGKLERIKTPHSTSSLGLFYQFLCEACGFDSMQGEEWKVMGLAPYGKFDARIHDILAKMIRVDGLRFVAERSGFKRSITLAELGACNVADLAHTGQRLFEDRMSELLRNLHGLGGSDNLVIAGGCGLNSSYNGLALQQTPFKQLYVFCAPADDGNAVGAALLAYYDDHPRERPTPSVRSPYLGTSVSPRALQHLRTLGRVPGRVSCSGDVVERAADLLAQGKIIGWMQGRAEFGPRALGNRSILADPRRVDIKEQLNDRVKFREEFRPFAPSILHEYGDEYFEDYQESPYMERTLRFREEARARVPGVVHVNGTGRLQTVKRSWNPRYYDLIEAFRQRTGVPILLNTSFNVMGKPIVHSLEDALAVFFTSGLDALVVENELIVKSE